MADYNKLWQQLQGNIGNALLAPARGYLAQAPQAPQSLGLLGQIHNAIDPVNMFGGYGGLLAMGLPPGGPKVVPFRRRMTDNQKYANALQGQQESPPVAQDKPPLPSNVQEALSRSRFAKPKKEGGAESYRGSMVASHNYESAIAEKRPFKTKEYELVPFEDTRASFLGLAPRKAWRVFPRGGDKFSTIADWLSDSQLAYFLKNNGRMPE